MPGGPYTRHESDWKDYPDTTTPVDAAFLDALELWLEGHAATATTGSHPASAITVADAAAQFSGSTVETVLAEVQDNLDAHLADASDAHDASAISILDTANDFTATDVEGALAEIQTDIEALSASGNGWVELSAASATAGASVTSTAEATPQDIITTGAITVAGRAVLVEFYCGRVSRAAGVANWVSVWEDSTNKGRLGQVVTDGQNYYGVFRYTPAAGSRNIKIRGWLGGAGTATYNGGAGGSGNDVPMLLRVTEAPA